MNECCGNCKYHQYEDISQGLVCCNQDSEYVADWTDYTDCSAIRAFLITSLSIVA